MYAGYNLLVKSKSSRENLMVRAEVSTRTLNTDFRKFSMDFDVKNEHVIALLYRDKLRSITMTY